MLNAKESPATIDLRRLDEAMAEIPMGGGISIKGSETISSYNLAKHLRHIITVLADDGDIYPLLCDDPPVANGDARFGKKVMKVGRYEVALTAPDPGEEKSLKTLSVYQRLAVRTVLRQVRDVEPEVLRYARRSMGLTRSQAAQRLGLSTAAVSGWEDADASQPLAGSQRVQRALVTLLNMSMSENDDAQVLDAVRADARLVTSPMPQTASTPGD